MTARKYFFVLVVIVLLLAAMVAAFNRVVDPFWYYRDISIDGFNAIKPKFKNYERYVKPAIVQREQPASLIFGSSFAEVGFDPQHSALRVAGNSYNFGLAGASWDRVVCAVQFSLAHDAALRQIVLGIHPDSMPQKDCHADIIKMEHPEERAFLFSYNAFEAAINTVLEQRDNKPSHRADGLYYFTRGLPGTANRFREVFALNRFCDMAHVNAGALATAPVAKQAVLDLNGLRDILHTAAAKGITVKLVIYPRHALSLEQQYQCGVRQDRWDAVAQIVALAKHEAGDSAQVWDFDGYHAISTETISENVATYWQDPTHFNSEFGNIMLDEMFALQPPAFGARLTADNLAARAASERAARTAYLSAHPEFLSQLESLLPQHGH